MLHDRKDMAFVKTLAVMAREFGIKTIAEYIESEDLLKAVHELGIDLAQGYHTGRPAACFAGNSRTTIPVCLASGMTEKEVR